MKKFVSLLLILGLVAFAFGIAGCSGKDSGQAGDEGKQQASQWPEREIRVIIPYKEGGASHRTAMLVKSIVDKNELLPQPMVVVCMPGANTILGQEEVLKANPDGYTLLAHHNAMLNAHAIDKYDFTYTDFKQVAQVWKSPIVLVARKDAPYDSFEELMAYVKENPDKKVKWGWVHLGGNTHFASYLAFQKSGLVPGEDIEPVMAGSGSEMAKYLAGGMCDVAVQLPASCAEYVKSGDFKVLAQSGDETMDMFGKKVKSFKEQGADFTYYLRFLYHAPKDTPPEIIDKLEEVLKEVVESPAYLERMEQEMCEPEFLGSEEATKAFAAEAENADAIGETVKEAMAQLKK